MPQPQERTDEESLKAAVEQAKLDILKIAADIDPLSPLRKHPVGSLGCALAGGIALGLLRPAKLAPFLPLALEAGELLLKRINAKYD